MRQSVYIWFLALALFSAKTYAAPCDEKEIEIEQPELGTLYADDLSTEGERTELNGVCFSLEGLDIQTEHVESIGETWTLSTMTIRGPGILGHFERLTYNPKQIEAGRLELEIDLPNELTWTKKLPFPKGKYRLVSERVRLEDTHLIVESAKLLSGNIPFEAQRLEGQTGEIKGEHIGFALCEPMENSDFRITADTVSWKEHELNLYGVQSSVFGFPLPKLKEFRFQVQQNGTYPKWINLYGGKKVGVRDFPFGSGLLDVTVDSEHSESEFELKSAQTDATQVRLKGARSPKRPMDFSIHLDTDSEMGLQQRTELHPLNKGWGLSEWGYGATLNTFKVSAFTGVVGDSASSEPFVHFAFTHRGTEPEGSTLWSWDHAIDEYLFGETSYGTAKGSGTGQTTWSWAQLTWAYEFQFDWGNPAVDALRIGRNGRLWIEGTAANDTLTVYGIADDTERNIHLGWKHSWESKTELAYDTTFDAGRSMWTQQKWSLGQMVQIGRISVKPTLGFDFNPGTWDGKIEINTPSTCLNIRHSIGVTLGANPKWSYGLSMDVR